MIEQYANLPAALAYTVAVALLALFVLHRVSDTITARHVFAAVAVTFVLTGSFHLSEGHTFSALVDAAIAGLGVRGYVGENYESPVERVEATIDE